MASISVPVWIFILLIGLTAVSLLWLTIMYIHQKCKSGQQIHKDGYGYNTIDPSPSGARFHNDLFSKQIDTIFNGLNAIIETERVKIKTLLNHSPGMSLVNEKNIDDPPVHIEQKPKKIIPDDGQSSLGQQIVSSATSGEKFEDIVDELGLSEAEVELAMKMRSSRDKKRGCKLEAVA